MKIERACGTIRADRYFLATLSGFLPLLAGFSVSEPFESGCLFISSSGERNGLDAGVFPALAPAAGAGAVLAICTGRVEFCIGAVPSTWALVVYFMRGLCSTD